MSLLLLPVLSKGFFVCYGLCLLTDVLDGWIARRTGTASTTGAWLDSICDVLFWGAVLWKLFPILAQQYSYLLLAALAVAAVRLLSYGIGWIRWHTFAAVHSILNKATGVSLVLLPVFVENRWNVGLWCLCALSVLSAMEELLLVLTETQFDPNKKGIWWKKRE